MSGILIKNHITSGVWNFDNKHVKSYYIVHVRTLPDQNKTLLSFLKDSLKFLNSKTEKNAMKLFVDLCHFFLLDIIWLTF